MDDVEVAKADVIKRLEENREKHEATYDQAVEAYRKEQRTVLEVLLTAARQGKQIDPFALSRLPVPEKHTDDYDTVLDMLAMENRPLIIISQRDFRTYMRDEWNWQGSFAANTVSYTRAQ